MEKLADLLESISGWTGRAIAWLTILMVLNTFLVVVLRYVFDTGWIAMQESTVYLHALVFMLGAAATLKDDAHVRVDIFYRGMSHQQRAWVDLMGTLLLLLPVCLFIFSSSLDYVMNSWQLREASPDAGGLPFVYLLKTTLLLMPLLLIIQGGAMVLRCLLVLKHKTTSDGQTSREEF